MEYKDKLKKVAVLGAAGKMGSGITLVTLLEQARLKFEFKENDYFLYAVDISEASLNGLLKYLRMQVVKAAEKNIIYLRDVYKDNPGLIENYDIIDQYVDDVMEIVRPVTKLENIYNSSLIFEAVIENADLKVEMFNKIRENSESTPWFLTNTSSVPIEELNNNAKLDGNIIGFHYYNPPAIQRLVELIRVESTNQELYDFSLAFAKSVKKIIVPSNDIAGFIGNGHFMRDLLFGVKLVKELSPTFSFAASVFAVNKISQEYLVRPMGIFQLIDYVGLDVCQKILKVMKDRSGDKNLHSEMIDEMVGCATIGGQNPDGSQKDGFLKYEKNRIVGVLDKCDYKDLDYLTDQVNEIIGKKPDQLLLWKNVVRAKNKEDLLINHFKSLKALNTKASQLAFKYLENSKNIALQLVSDKVAFDEKGVNDVLVQGFHHAYGPINNYVNI